jgi:hypothetical protein
MSLGVALLVFVVLLVTFIVLEGKRQERIYGPSSRRIGLAGAGLLELQRHLQPERKVEVLKQERDETEQDAEGDPPEPGNA